MSKLEEYARITALRKEMFQECFRGIDPFIIGPTNNGGMFLQKDGKDICKNLTVADLRALRNLIDMFLVSVVGESK